LALSTLVHHHDPFLQDFSMSNLLLIAQSFVIGFFERFVEVLWWSDDPGFFLAYFAAIDA
jgi:hypothetical protein